MSIRYGAALAAAFITAPAIAADLEITVRGLEQPAGYAMIAVYASQAAMDDGVGSANLKIAVGETGTVRAIVDLPAGRYAVAVFHDENANGKLDTNIVKFPVEPTGFGNNARGSFGPATFDDAAVDLTDAGARADIVVR
ncbi:MAG: DUF2141 domain-containing protein [Alphaproteobacteria bacterium]